MLFRSDSLYKSLIGKFSVKLDDDDQNKPGWKFSEWEMQGVPVRIEIGPRDMEKNQVVLARRDTGEKIAVNKEHTAKEVKNLLEDIQNNLFRRAAGFRQKNTFNTSAYGEFKEIINAGGGFIQAGWCGSPTCEAGIKEETKATIRALPLAHDGNGKKCIYCGGDAAVTAVFAKAY